MLASTSGEPVQLVGRGDWITHELLQSTTSLHRVGQRQRQLYLRAQLVNGSADDLAEALLLFGLAPLCEGRKTMPVLHVLGRTVRRNMVAKFLLLIAAGVPVDQRDKRGETLLHRACRLDPHGDYPAPLAEVVATRRRLARLLLANGADPLAENHRGDTPVDLAGDSGEEELISLFDPDADTSDFDLMRPAILRAYAEKRQWRNVMSLLDEIRHSTHPATDRDGDVSMSADGDRASDHGKEG